MKEVFSKVAEVKKSPEEVIDVLKNPTRIKDFLESVPEEYLPGELKEKIKYVGDKGIEVDFSGTHSEIMLEEVTEKHVKYGIKLPGVKEGVLFIQVLPSDCGSKMRLAGGYSLGFGPIGLFLRSRLNDKEVQEAMDGVVDTLAESFNKEREG